MKINFIVLLLLLCVSFSIEKTFAQEVTEISKTEEIIATNSNNTDNSKVNVPISKKKIEEVGISMNFIYGLLIDLFFMIVIVYFIYFKNYKKTETLFTFFLFNLVVYLLTYFLNYIKLSTGAAFGLFAIFSMLRYRTESINTRDMTYLFVFIAMALLSAIQLKFIDLLIIQSIILVVIFMLDSKLIMKREFYYEIQIDNLEMIRPENKEELINKIQTFTGLEIHRISVRNLNFKTNSAQIKAYYYK